MEFISQLGLDSWGGFFSFVATVVLTIGPFLYRSSKRRKEALAKLQDIPGNYIIIYNSKNWLPAPAKILEFVFYDGPIVISSKKIKSVNAHGSSPLVAVVEFQDVKGEMIKANVFVDDKYCHENVIINILYNPLDKKQIILA